MATTPKPPAGVEFVQEDDGRVTARHVDSGVSSFGDTEAEALRQLADALDSHFGHGEKIEDPDEYLEERGIDVDIGEAGDPPWLDRRGADDVRFNGSTQNAYQARVCPGRPKRESHDPQIREPGYRRSANGDCLKS